jgi:hypothetical protein
MLNSHLRRVLGCLLVCMLSASVFSSIPTPLLASEASPVSESEATLWSMEHSYWRYVQANDLTAYRNS